jgi:glyoxylase-like metal-dependent hydrolase (beta-lactamase superfamily II)
VGHVEPIRVGRIEVRPVCEGFAPLLLDDEMPGSDVDWGAEREAYPWAFIDERRWPWHVHAFHIDTPQGAVVVDTGLGEFPPFAPWTEQVVDPWAEVDVGVVGHVVLTHMHADHAGGAVVGGRPRFPNARYHLHDLDRDRFAGADDAVDYVASRAVSALDERGMLAVGVDDGPVAPGVSVVHTPGHTPGHRSVLVREGAHTLLITGDVLHQPVQVRLRDRPSSHDDDPGLGVRTRRDLLDDAESGGWAVAVQHFARPFGRIAAGAWLGI